MLKEIDYDLKNTVFSFIPNTAEMSYYGILKATENYLSDVKLKKLKNLPKDASEEDMKSILSIRTRAEKILVKDAKLRTFITQDDGRDEMVAHVYDITYGSIKRKEDNIVGKKAQASATSASTLIIIIALIPVEGDKLGCPRKYEDFA